MVINKYSIFDKVIEGVQIINHAWQYIYVNDTVVLQSKYTKEELLGCTMMEKYPGIETSEMFKCLDNCMRNGGYHQMTNEFDYPDGTKGYFQLRIQPIAEGTLILSFDITKQKLAEQFLKDTNAVLDEKANQRTVELLVKNKELEQFAYIASHDLQEPLRTISNYIELIQEDYEGKLDATISGYLNSMSNTTERMSRMIKALLNFFYIGINKKLTTVDFIKLVNKVLADLEQIITSSGAIISVGALPTLNAYEIEMQQLFQHLITNAIKFRKENAVPEISIQATKTADKWQFSVRDNGIGIDAAHHERIFDIFQRLHLNEVYEGNGIGLANGKKIVTLHGGEIHVESALGQGSNFIFTISKLL